MNTFSNAFRAEVVRMARKELKPELQGMRKAITGHRSEIAALKREVKALTSQLKATQRQVKATDAPKAKVIVEKATPQKSKQIQFDAQLLIEKACGARHHAEADGSVAGCFFDIRLQVGDGPCSSPGRAVGAHC